MNLHELNRRHIIIALLQQERIDSGCKFGQPDGEYDYITDCDCDEAVYKIHAGTDYDIYDLFKEVHAQWD